MDGPVERHQLVFLNPDLAGLFAAYLSHRAGARVAILDELKRWRTSTTDFPIAFPADGTFRPSEVDTIAADAGFPPPVWQRIPLVEMDLPGSKVSLNADAGVGALMLSMIDPFRVGRSVILAWLQNQITRTREYMSVNGGRRMTNLRSVETSVADAVIGLKLPDPDPFITLLDTLSILVMGRGAVQIDVRDFHLVLASFLNGWHSPAPGERNWAEVLLRRLRKEGARYHELDAIDAVQSFGKHLSMIRGSDNTLSAAQLLVVPENDRFRLPAATDVSTIRWHNWHGRFTSRPEGPTRLGVLRPDPRRAPLNDNFVAWRIGEQSSDGFTVSAPVESRYLDGERIGTVTSKLKYLLATRLGWQIARIESASSIPIGQPINLPGTAPAVSYPEGPLYGDDVLSRLKSADRLSRRIVESLK